MLSGLVAGLVRHTVILCGLLPAEAGFHGLWQLGVLVDGLSGAKDIASLEALPALDRAQPYSQETFERVTEAVVSDLLGRPGEITGRLVRRLLQGLAVQNRRDYSALLEDALPPHTPAP